MARDWEATFSFWAQSPGDTEQERSESAIRAIRKAIDASAQLNARKIKVFPQGSYRNRVTVRMDSDVDVGVMLYDYFLSDYPVGKSDAAFGNTAVDYTFGQFKNELEEALVARFGRAAVMRGNKAFTVRENTYHLEADVAPFFEFRRYWDDGTYRAGVAMLPDVGPRIDNFPERLVDHWPNVPLHYENGICKNDATSRTFKGVVRILKRLRGEMVEAGHTSAQPIPGYLLECLVWNVPNEALMQPTWDRCVQASLLHLWSNLKDDTPCHEWCEVDNIKYLFRPQQKWRRPQAFTFVDEAWSYVGVR